MKVKTISKYLIKIVSFLKSSPKTVFCNQCKIIPLHPLAPKSDSQVTSPYDFHTLFRKQIMRIHPNLFGKSYLDLIPNSYDSSTRKCEAAEGKN